MKIVILCGGFGTRLSEETKLKPKPMVKIGRKPIVCHIMDTYERNGFNNFILALGYKGKVMKNYFSKNKRKSKINMVYTGKNTLTGGRLLKLKNLFSKNENFMLTYGDGLTNQNIKKLLSFHKNHGKIATITAVRPQLRFGELKVSGTKVKSFREKPQSVTGWVNGGFFVFNSKIFNYIKNSQTMLEREPLEKLARTGQLVAFKHHGFWQCMDTMRDKKFLNKLWYSKKAPWNK